MTQTETEKMPDEIWLRPAWVQVDSGAYIECFLSEKAGFSKYARANPAQVKDADRAEALAEYLENTDSEMTGGKLRYLTNSISEETYDCIRSALSTPTPEQGQKGDDAIDHFRTNIDGRSAADCFESACKAVKNHDRCVVDKQEMERETWYNIFVSECLRLCREYEHAPEIRAALNRPVSGVDLRKVRYLLENYKSVVVGERDKHAQDESFGNLYGEFAAPYNSIIKQIEEGIAIIDSAGTLDRDDGMVPIRSLYIAQLKSDLKKLSRQCEESAAIMRNQTRTCAWEGSETVAQSYDRKKNYLNTILSELEREITPEGKAP